MGSSRPAIGPHRLTRRQLMAGAASLAVPIFVPASVLGRQATAPSERITVAAIGAGVRGAHALASLLPLDDAQVLAVCDVRKPRLDAAVQRMQDFYADKLGKAKWRGCTAYHDFQELLARPDIDALLVCPPDHWHGVVMTRAAQAGKDMYGEKPISRTIAEGIVVRDAVRRGGIVFQTGTQQRSDPNFRQACELARNGYVGKIHTVEVAAPGGRTYETEPPAPVPAGFDYDRWTGPAPFIPFDNKRCEWLAMYMISHYCAGFICNWGVHHLDIAQWGCPEITTEPFELDGKGQFPQDGMTDTCIAWTTEFRYPSGLRMTYSNDDNPNATGCRFVGDEGWVHVNRSGIWAKPASLLRVQLKPGDLHLHASPYVDPNVYTNHTADFLRAVRNRRDPVSSIDDGHRASTLGNVADIMVRLGRKVKWDWKTERFVDDDEANAMLSRPMRSPWTL